MGASSARPRLSSDWVRVRRSWGQARVTNGTTPAGREEPRGQSVLTGRGLDGTGGHGDTCSGGRNRGVRADADAPGCAHQVAR